MITAAQIRAGRNMINAKQTELAKAAGVSLATLNNIERAIGDPRASTLESIERALSAGGITFDNDGSNQIVSLNAISRPSAYDTFSASQRVLEALTPTNLLKVDRILFFCRRAHNVHTSDDQHRICLAIEGRARTVLFDQVNFTVANAARAAEVAGILLAVFVLFGKKVFYLDKTIEDTTINEPSEVLRKLIGEEWLPMLHPHQFFDVFDDWDGHVSLFADHKNHPMRDLIDLLSRN